MRALVLIAVAACGSARSSGAPEGRDAALADARSGDAATEVPDAAAAAAVEPAALPAIHATHASEITRITLADDGTAALTADNQGHVRLWPTLDGKREPAIVRIAAPIAFALTHAGDDLLVGAIDGAGSLEVARMTLAGEQRSHVQVELGGGAHAVIGTPHGFLVERADRTLALVDAAGSVTHTLVPPPGRDVEAIVYRSGQALAILGTGTGKPRGRWITLPDLAWGDETVPLPIDAGQLALSPDHLQLATVQGQRLVTVELATGRKKKIFDGDPASDGDVRQPVDLLGFTAPDVVVAKWSGYQMWFRGAQQDNGDEFSGPAAAADGHTVTGLSMQLAISTAHHTRYLGYRIDSGYHTWFLGDHIMVGGRGDIAVTDPAGHTQHAYRVKDRERISEIYPLDLTHALVMRNNTTTSTNDLVLVTLPDKDGGTVFAHCPARSEYEPSTGFLVCHDAGNVLSFYHYDRKTAAFTGPIQLTPSQPSWIRLVDPARAKGTLAFRIELYPATYVWPIRAIHTDGRSEPFEEGDKLPVESAVLDSTPESLKQAGVSPLARAHGGLVARLDQSRLSLRRGKTTLWEVAVPTAQDVMWTSHGELVVVGSGIARVDLATGALIDPQCGWAFGLWAEANENFGGSLLCED